MTKRNLSEPPKESPKRVNLSAPAESLITSTTTFSRKLRANSTPLNAHNTLPYSLLQTSTAHPLPELLEKELCVSRDTDLPADHLLRSNEYLSPAPSNSDEAHSHVVAITSIRPTGLQTPLTPHGLSLNNTIIPEDSANSIQPFSGPLTSFTAPETFPIFGSGDVLIITNLVSSAKQWQLHSTVLACHSSWFESSMQDNTNRESKHSIAFSYIIKVVHDKVALVRQSAASCMTSRPTGDYVKDIEIYNHTFGAFYNVPNTQPAMTISETLEFAERLVEVAHNLGCTHLMASQIGNMFLQHRKELFVAIKNDPARWLLLAFRLQNDIIYTEALIHLVGAHPCWPWPTKQAMLPEEISRLIVSKSGKLDQMCLEAERNLLCLSICVGSRLVRPEGNSEFDTWFIVATFRDVLARELYALGNDNRCSLRRGTLFRKIFRGGSAYMSYEPMRSLMEKVMPSAVDSLSEDLNMLKRHASEYVKELAKNELILDIESNSVGYLTCIKITAEDIQWRTANTSYEEKEERT